MDRSYHLSLKCVELSQKGHPRQSTTSFELLVDCPPRLLEHGLKERAFFERIMLNLAICISTMLRKRSYNSNNFILINNRNGRENTVKGEGGYRDIQGNEYLTDQQTNAAIL